MKFKQLVNYETHRYEGDFTTHRIRCDMFDASIQEYPNHCLIMCDWSDVDNDVYESVLTHEQQYSRYPNLEAAKAIVQSIFEKTITEKFLEE